MDDAARLEIADSLEKLADLKEWDDDVWQHCYDLVCANIDNELLAYVHDDLIHCSGVGLFDHFFHKNPKPKYFGSYQEEFRNIARGLRSGMSIAEFKRCTGHRTQL